MRVWLAGVGLGLVVAGAISGCVGSGELAVRVSGQIVGIDERPLGPGLVLVERGKVHEGSYELGTLIDEQGHFVFELPEGGTWGLHVFHDDYQYLPIEITVGDHQQVTLTSGMVAWGVWMDLTGLPTWPPQPGDETLIRMPYDDVADDNPVIDDIGFQYLDGGLVEVHVDTHDPNGDLSRMVLAYDADTGAGYALNPPAPPDEHGNYPNGHYTMKFYLGDEDVPGQTPWYFVVSDNMCNNTPIHRVVLPPRP